MKGSPRRDALTAKFLLPPYALGSSASTVGPRKPSRRRCAGNRVLFTRGAEEPPRPEPGCLVGEGEQHEILGAFSSPRGAGQIKACLLPQRLGPGAGEGRPGHQAPGPAQAVAFCSPAPVDPALAKEVAYHRLFILERTSRAGEESESLPASSH